MLGIRLQRDGTLAAADPAQDQGDSRVDSRREKDDDDAEPWLRQRGGFQEPADGLGPDSDSRQDDQRPLDTAREILNLAVTVGMVFVRWPGAQGQRDQRYDRRAQVDQSLQSVGKKGHRSGEDEGAGLHAKGQQRGADREPGVTGQLGARQMGHGWILAPWVKSRGVDVMKAADSG